MFVPEQNQLALSTNGNEALRIDQDGNVGIQVQDPLATLHVGGNLIVEGTIISSAGKTGKESSISVPTIRRLSLPEETITIRDETIILEGSVERLNLPVANSVSIGVTHILKNLGNQIIQLNISFNDLQSQKVSYLDERSVIHIQSDGVEWQQIR